LLDRQSTIWAIPTAYLLLKWRKSTDQKNTAFIESVNYKKEKMHKHSKSEKLYLDACSLTLQQSTLDKVFMNAENLGNHLRKYMFLLYTGQYILEKGLMNVRNVAHHWGKVLTSLYTRKSTLQKGFMRF
jgi:hypothetical protein